MKKLLLILLFISFNSTLKADEGFWLTHLLKGKYEEMKKKGLKLSQEDIYSINNASLKDAIISFSGNCTANVVSKNGLILTNQHCAIEYLNQISTDKNNFLKDGFNSKKIEDELPIKNAYVRFLIKVEDVSARIQKINSLTISQNQKENLIENEYKKIQIELSNNEKYKIEIKSYLNKSQTYCFIYKEFKDIRLVLTTPNSEAFFGGNAARWSWKKYSGDFAFFRIYSDVNGEPSEYSFENIPLKTKTFLPINTQGIKEQDFAFSLGFPNHSNRFLSSYGIEELTQKEIPIYTELTSNIIDLINVKSTNKEYKIKNDNLKFDKQQKEEILNFAKNNKIILKEKRLEKVLSYTKSNVDLLKELNNLYLDSSQTIELNTLYSIILPFSEYISFPYRCSDLLKEYANESKEEQKKLKPIIETIFKDYFISINDSIEKEIFHKSLMIYSTKIKKNKENSVFNSIDFNDEKNKNKIYNLINESIFSNKESALAFLNNPTIDKINTDFLLKTSLELYNDYKLKSKIYTFYEKKIKIKNEIYQQQFLKENYFDADNTLRLSFGEVKSEIINDFSSNSNEKMGLYKLNDPNFHIPLKIVQNLISKENKKYFGENGININFITNQDSVQGNSGSAILNGNGQIIGLLYDSNKSGITSEYFYDKKNHRSVNIDIRYILFLVEHYFESDYVLKELSILD